jgi:RNA polymerase sigma-70 factor (ECF subfamily)
VHEKITAFNFESKLSTWIATIAYRMGINHLRKKKIELSDIPEEESFTAHYISADDPHESMEDNEIEAMTLKLIDQLPPHYKTILVLYHVDQMNYGEIGEVTGMPEGTVKNYLFRARNLLKEKVKKYLGKEQLL